MDRETKAASLVAAGGGDEMMGTSGRRLVDIDGAAEHLTVSVRYVRTLVGDRRIPYLKVGKYVRFDLNELDDWLDGCRVQEAS